MEDYEQPLEFWQLVLRDKWDKVIEKYQEDSFYHKKDINGRGTALHVAVSNGRKNEVKSLVEAIVNKGNDSSLKEKNEIGATALHLAAYRGYTDVCELIIGKEGERAHLIQEKNEKGETPLFWAVLGRHTLVFVYLRQFYPFDLSIALDNKNTSILHVAIEREMFDLAFIIMYCYKGLISVKDKNHNIPLEILATRTSAFVSGSRLSWWKRILYSCFTISSHDQKTTMGLLQSKLSSEENAKNAKGDYRLEIHDAEQLEKAYQKQISLAQTCLNIQKCVFRWSILSLLDIEEIKTIKKKHEYGGRLLKEFMKTSIQSYIGGGSKPESDNMGHDDEIYAYNPAKKLKPKQEVETSMQEREENKKLEDSTNTDGKDTTLLLVAKTGVVEIMKELNSKVPSTSDNKDLFLVAMKNITTGTKRDVKDTAYLIAASHGIFEMMFELKSEINSVIHDTNSNDENALLLAVKYKQPRVIQWLETNLTNEDFQHLTLQIDKHENTMLHLAAYTSFHRENTWMISGAAMQMMWDIKWYMYIKDLVPERFYNRSNKEGNTPSEIFKEQHKEILERSVEWLKNTAQSCSVVAALIAGVSFTTSGSVPGGNQQSGEPTLKGKPAFEGFAISSLIGLYFSVTSLILFLSILTSQKEVEDFRRSLPMKLLFGLCSLFVSIVAMFVSFCAGHFFVLTDKYTSGGLLFYLYISICFPVTFYAVVQFSLFIDLVKIIWKKVPPTSVKGVLL